MNRSDDILSRLEKDPEDWDLRLEAIENAIRAGDLDESRRLVRESPAESPTPPEIQVRLHALLTQGAAALPATPEPVPGEDVSDSTETEALREGETYGGGASALIEEEATDFRRGEDEPKAASRVAAPTLFKNSVQEKWDDYDGELELVDAEYVPRYERPNYASEKFSSLSVAVAAHLILLVIVGMVVITVPNPPPPQLIASVVHEREADLLTPRFVRTTPEIRPAAASAQALDVISSLSTSTFTVPDVEDAADSMAVSMLPGFQPLGNGMSLDISATKASDVNFFGISASGNKVVFIIDATPHMLVDEKGGMTAYDNVKEEVGIMLANLNRNTHFNVLLYQGKRLVAYRDELVPGLPSNLRMAIEWLDPLNRDYDALGLRDGYGESLSVKDHEEYEIASRDVAHYTKAVQKAMEWGANAIFCISSGYVEMRHSPTPEMIEEMKKLREENPGTPGTVSPGAQKAWQSAVAKTRAWLAKENAARREKGVSQKVVTNFNQLVQQRTGVSPPRATGGTPAGGANFPRLPRIEPEDVEGHLKKVKKYEYDEKDLDEPSLHIVFFLGEDERIRNAEDHFRRLTNRNNGKLKILRGLAALEDVTSTN